MVTRRPHQVCHCVTNSPSLQLFYYELHTLCKCRRHLFPPGPEGPRGGGVLLRFKARLHFLHGLKLDLYRADRLARNFQEPVQIW